MPNYTLQIDELRKEEQEEINAPKSSAFCMS
jgi:hypothetical protein